MEIFGDNSEFMAPVNSFQLITMLIVALFIVGAIVFIKTDLDIKKKLKKLQKTYDEILEQQELAINSINRSFQVISSYINTDIQEIETDKLYYTEEIEMYLGYISELADANYIDDVELRMYARDINKACGLIQKNTEKFLFDCKGLFVDNSSFLGRIALEVHKGASIDKFHKLQEFNRMKDEFSETMTKRAQQSNMISSSLNEI